jgi:undecaprenyl-diphosphatase
MASLAQILIGLDHQLFVLVNQTLASSWLDPFFVVLTNFHKLPLAKFFLFPVLILGGVFRYRWKFLKWILALSLVIAATDAFNYRVLKKISQRARPILVPEVHAVVRTPPSPKDPSFPSNHAVNITAAATLLSLVIPALRPVFFLIAALVIYSRPYVGVHFPLDVLMGSLVGFCIARIMIRQIFQRFAWWEFPPKKTS